MPRKPIQLYQTDLLRIHPPLMSQGQFPHSGHKCTGNLDLGLMPAVTTMLQAMYISRAHSSLRATTSNHLLAPWEDLLHEKSACGTTQTGRNGDWGAARNL